MKCQNCGSENVSPDLAITHQELIKKNGECVNILADLCKDCGTVRRYVKDKDDEYTSREEYSQLAKRKRIWMFCLLLGVLLLVVSFFCLSSALAKALCSIGVGIITVLYLCH